MFTLAFAISFLAASILSSPNNTSAEGNEDTSTTTAGDYTLSVSTTKDVNLSLSVGDSDTMTVSKANVNVFTNSPGYKLFLSTLRDTTDLSADNISGVIAATSGTKANPTALTRGTWGYAIPSGTSHIASNGFDATYTEQTSVSPINSVFAAPSTISSPELIASSPSATSSEGDDYPIYYAVMANADTNPGAYSNSLTFTAVADASTTDKLTLTPDNTSIDTAVNVTVQTPLYTTASYADANIYFLTEEQHTALSAKSTKASTLPAPLSCTKVTSTPLTYNCSVPAQSKIGTYYIYANVPRYDISYDAPFEVTNMVTLTVDPNGGTWSGQSTSQQFTQNEGTTKNIADPTGPAFTISYDANGQGASFNPTPASINRAFTSWTPAGGGTYANGVYTFGATSGSLTATYADTATFTLPAITKTNYSCSWAEGTASGTKHNGGDEVTISTDSTFVATCSINPMLTVDPAGGTWSGKTTTQDFYQVSGTTKSIDNPENPTYTITWNDNGQGASYDGTPTSITPTFSSWTLSGSGTWNAVSKLYTFGSANGTLTATYTNNTITLPAITKTNYTCKWAEGSTSGTQYEAGTTRPITANTSYYAICAINPKLTVNPNGGTWNSSSASQDFYQVAGTTKSIANPTAPSWTISYDMNDTGITKPTSPTSVTRSFTSWSLSGGGSFTSGTYTFGSTDGTLTATYNDSPTITLPALSKTGHDCQWAAGSTTGTKYNSGATNVPISANTTFYAVCTIKSYTLTINANGGAYTPATVTQNYNTTYTLGNPTSAPTYTVSYDMGSTGITKPTSPTSASRSFTSWSKSSGEGTLSGSTWTFGAGDGAVIANYGNGSFTLPAISKTNYTCKWAEGSASGTQYAGGTSRTISANTTYHAVCTYNPLLTVNPNGGTWSGSTSSQTFRAAPNSKKTIDNPSANAKYTIAYNANSQGATYTGSPTSATRNFSSWSLSGGGSFSNGTYTYATTDGTLTASYNSTSNSFTLPTITKSNYLCGWRAGSTSGTWYDSGKTGVTVAGNTTFYASCRPTLTAITKMQDMTSQICTDTAIGTGKTLTDSRDNNTYTVKKLKDGKCWMTQNLKLTGPRTLTSADSNVTSNFTLPATNTSFPTSCANTAYNMASGNTTYGNYYNWYAATAGTGTCSTSSGNTAASICPKGWHLPTGGDSGEFQTLYNNYNSSALMQGDPAFVLSGHRQASVTKDQGSSGSYWSSTANNASRAYRLYLTSSSVGPKGYASKFFGLPVRCIAQ